MAVSSTTVNWDEINSTTQRRVLPMFKEQIFRSNPTSMRLWRKGTKLDGGERIHQGLIYAEGPGGWFSGLEVLDTTEVDQVTNAIFEWKELFLSVTIKKIDELKNRGKARIANLLTLKMQTAQKSGKNYLGQGLHSDGVSNTKAMTGLRAMVTASGTTYGNISKTTYSWWRSVVDSTTTVLTIPVMRGIVGDITEDMERPDMIVTTQNLYDKYYNQLQPQQRFADKDVARGGFKNVLFEGIPVTVDSHCPAGYMYFLNTSHIDLVSHQDDNFAFEPFKKPINQRGRTAFITWTGNLTGSNCRFQAVLSNLSES